MTALVFAAALAALPAAARPILPGVKTAELSSPGAEPVATPSPPPAGYTPAPVPDPDITAPRSPGSGSRPEVVPQLYRGPDRFYNGEGYLPGSTMQGEQNKRVLPAPGLNLRLPLE